MQCRFEENVQRITKIMITQRVYWIATHWGWIFFLVLRNGRAGRIQAASLSYTANPDISHTTSVQSYTARHPIKKKVANVLLPGIRK